MLVNVQSIAFPSSWSW